MKDEIKKSVVTFDFIIEDYVWGKRADGKYLNLISVHPVGSFLAPAPEVTPTVPNTKFKPVKNMLNGKVKSVDNQNFYVASNGVDQAKLLGALGDAGVEVKSIDG